MGCGWLWDIDCQILSRQKRETAVLLMKTAKASGFGNSIINGFVFSNLEILELFT